MQDAKVFYEENGNTYWWDAICKEMKNIRPDFEVWEKDISELPPGYQKITCHIIFYVKMGNNFRRKAQLFSDGHKPKTPEAITYLAMVPRYSVWIALTIAEFNDLDVLDCDILNAYITADYREQVWVVAGPKFGSEAGQNMLVKKSLYGLKSSVAAFRAFLVETLDVMGYNLIYSDPELWIRPAVYPDVFVYYEYIPC